MLSGTSFNSGFVKEHPYNNILCDESKHETLPNSLGVQFNVETSPIALEENLVKKKLNIASMLGAINGDAYAFYGVDSDSPFYHNHASK